MSEERPQRNNDAQRASARPKRDDDSLPTRDDADDDGRAPRNREPDVLLDVSELEVEKITLEVVGLRAHVSVVAQLANLVNLQVGVDARLNRVKLEIEGVKAKVLLKVWLDNVRAILEKALETLGEHPEILTGLIESINKLLEGKLGDAVGALDNVLESLEEGARWTTLCSKEGWRTCAAPSSRYWSKWAASRGRGADRWGMAPPTPPRGNRREKTSSKEGAGQSRTRYGGAGRRPWGPGF